jgi:hypothetical protein
MRFGSVVVAVVALLAGPCGAGEASPLAVPEDPPAESPARNDEPAVEDFGWMAGHWRGEGLGGICEEIWTGPLGGSMVGLFRLIREGELVFSEHMMLARDPDGIVLKVKHFTPDFVAWEDKEGAVRFRLEELRPNEAVFKGLRIRRTEPGLEIVIRMKDASGKTRDETITLRQQR